MLEENRRGLVQDSSSSRKEEKENVALSPKSKKKSKKDLSKVWCFACSQYGHFAS